MKLNQCSNCGGRLLRHDSWKRKSILSKISLSKISSTEEETVIVVKCENCGVMGFVTIPTTQVSRLKNDKL